MILDGKKLAQKLLIGLKREIEKRHLKLKMAAILVGKNKVSEIFIRQKQKACEFVGISFELFKFPAKIRTLELKEKIEKITNNPHISGVIVQLPLSPQVFYKKTWGDESKKFSPEDLLNLIPEEKDIDVLSEKSLGKFYQGQSLILPPVVKAVFKIFKEYKIALKGKNIVIVGTGRLVGSPLSVWLLQKNATLLVVNEFTKNIADFIKKADILISGAGKPNLIKGDMVKKGAVVIDTGTAIYEGKLRGDVDFESVSKKASHITPVPGGVGPLTVACLLENLVALNKK